MTNSSLRLYECFCDIRVTKCLMWVTEEDEGFYGIYLVTSVKQETENEAVAVKDTYSNYVLCDNSNNFLYDAECRRLQWDDKTCETSPCMEYSIEMNVTSCSYPCSILLWVGFDNLTFSNFGDIPEPVRDLVCPVERPGTSQFSNSTIQDTTITFLTRNDSTGDIRNGTDFGRGDTTERESFVSGMTYTGVGGGTLVLVLAALGLYRYTKENKKKRNDEGNPASFGQSHSSSELSRVDSDRAEATSSSREDLEIVMYQTLDEVTDDIDGQPNGGGVDEQDYDLVMDCDNDVGDECRASKCPRPLPRPPKPGREENRTRLRTPPGTRVAKSLSLIKSKPTATSDASNLRSPGFSSISTQPSDPRPQPLLKSQCLAETAQSMTFPSVLPRPHKRLVDLKDHKSIGLVKLRQDQAVFGEVTEVKLIRTLTGHLELVNIEEELPVFVEYYTRLLLIKSTEGSMGIAGLVDTHEDLSGENKFTQQLPPGRGEKKESSGSEIIASSNNKHARYSDTVDKPNPTMIFFGSVSLDDDVRVDQSDYLTVLDIDRCDTSTSSDGYQTVLDTENNLPTSSDTCPEPPKVSDNSVTIL